MSVGCVANRDATFRYPDNKLRILSIARSCVILPTSHVPMLSRSL